MPEWGAFGKVLIGLGLGILVVGTLLVVVERVPGLGSIISWIGKLPGDISIKRDNFSFYFPITTSIVFSILLSLLFYLIGWLFRR